MLQHVYYFVHLVKMQKGCALYLLVMFCTKGQYVINTALKVSPCSLGCGFQIPDMEIKVVPEFVHSTLQFPSEILLLVRWHDNAYDKIKTVE